METDSSLTLPFHELLDHPSMSEEIWENFFAPQVLIYLGLLDAFLVDHPEKLVEDGTLDEIESLAAELLQLFGGYANQSDLSSLPAQIRQLLLSPLENWREAATQIFDEEGDPMAAFSQYIKPRNGQFVFIDHLSDEMLLEVIENGDKQSTCVMYVSHTFLIMLQSLAGEFNNVLDPGEEYMLNRVAAWASQVEYVVDSFQVGHFRTWLSCLCLFDFFLHYKEHISQFLARSIEWVLGFYTKRLFEALFKGPHHTVVISVVDCDEVALSEFSNSLCHDEVVISEFKISLWGCVSKQYRKRDLLLQLLDQIVDIYDLELHTYNEVQLSTLLYKHLKKRKFLIVLYGMTSIEAWNDLKVCLPADSDSNRVIVATTVKDLAFQLGPETVHASLRRLTDDESWLVFRACLFKDETYPPELLYVGREIVKLCKGSYWSIGLVAGILKYLDKSTKQWEQVAKSLKSHFHGDVETMISGIIGMAYDHLPDYLKPCLLYFGVFTDIEEIPITKLFRLWSAEGYSNYKSPESDQEEAEKYLEALRERELVTYVKKKSIDGVKSVYVHSLVRKFCLAKAEEESFLRRTMKFDEQSPRSITDVVFLSPTTTERRLSINSKRNEFSTLRPEKQLIHKLHFSSDGNMWSTSSFDVSIFLKLKFLKILDLEDVIVSDSLDEIKALVLLRYLSIQGLADSIPSSITNLWNLETFIYEGLGVKVIKVPTSIWDMVKLRHLHINPCASFDLKAIMCESSKVLNRLQTLSTPSLAYGEDWEQILRKLQSLLKLKCIFLDSWDETINCNQFLDLSCLNQLVSLKVFHEGESKYPCAFSLPPNLKKLTLSKFQMPWSEISQLAGLLPKLEVLKLQSNAFEGERWQMEEEAFRELRFLKLESLDIEEWIASEEHFPKLQSLILHRCKQLKEIPSGFGQIRTLQEIDLRWCSSSASHSARAIKEKLELKWDQDSIMENLRSDSDGEGEEKEEEEERYTL